MSTDFRRLQVVTEETPAGQSHGIVVLHCDFRRN